MVKNRLGQCVSLLATAGVLSLSGLAMQVYAAAGSKLVVVETETIVQTSAELSAELGKKWGAVLTQGYGVSERGLKMFVDGYASYPAEVLKSALSAKNFETMNRTLMDHNQTLVNALAEKVRNDVDSMDPQAHQLKAEMRKLLGDEARDLVYIPITPCRTLDTRSSTVAGTNGQVVPGTPRSALVFWDSGPSNWTLYGGTVASCPDTVKQNSPLSNAAPFSVALNLGIVSPTGNGWVTAYRNDLADPSTTVVSQLIQAGVNDTALLIVNVCRGVTGASCSFDIKIASQGTNTHVATDVVGYFIKPQATALQCTTVVGTSTALPASSANTFAPAPACAAGFTGVGVLCNTDTNANRILGTNLSGCFSANNSATAATVTTSSVCCRTPGR